MGDGGALSGEATGSPPRTKAGPSPASYPGTVVKAWHAGDALVSLLAFLQEGGGAGLLPLDTVPTDALGGRGEGRAGSEPARKGQMENPHHLPGRQPSHPHFAATSLRQLCSSLRGPHADAGFAFPSGSSSGGAPPKPLSRQACGGRQRGPQRHHLSRLFLQPAPAVRTGHGDLGCEGRFQTASPGAREAAAGAAGPLRTPGMEPALCPRQIPVVGLPVPWALPVFPTRRGSSHLAWNLLGSQSPLGV